MKPKSGSQTPIIPPWATSLLPNRSLNGTPSSTYSRRNSSTFTPNKASVLTSSTPKTSIPLPKTSKPLSTNNNGQPVGAAQNQNEDWGSDSDSDSDADSADPQPLIAPEEPSSSSSDDDEGIPAIMPLHLRGAQASQNTTEQAMISGGDIEDSASPHAKRLRDDSSSPLPSPKRLRRLRRAAYVFEDSDRGDAQYRHEGSGLSRVKLSHETRANDDSVAASSAQRGTQKTKFIPIVRGEIQRRGDADDDDEYYESESRLDNGNSSPDALFDTAVVNGNQRRGPANPFTRTADDERLYQEWWAPDGSLIRCAGAILPTGYHTLDSNPSLPWICPVRDCQKLFHELHKLRSHMGAKHCRRTFNDNMDGTLSSVGLYKKPDGTSPPVVVSQNAIGPNAPRPATPTPNDQWRNDEWRRLKKKLVGQNQDSLLEDSFLGSEPGVAGTPGNSSPPKSRGALTAQSGGQPGKMLAYISERLGYSVEVPSKEKYVELLWLPRVRDLPPKWRWNADLREGKIKKSLVLCTIIYLTGDAGANACSDCLDGDGSKRGFECVVTPASASHRLGNLLKGSCASCLLLSKMWHRRNDCSYLHDHQPPLNRVVSAEEELPKIAPLETSSMDSSAVGGSTEKAVVVQQSKAAKTRRPATLRPPPQEADVTRSPALTMGTSGDAEELLEMEGWEIAPGRIRETSKLGADNVAFSNSFLTSNQAIPISNDVSFNVAILKPGSSMQWAADESKLRVCSVATGKVRVTIDGADDFALGPNSMFKVRPGAACVAQNRLYVDATIHVSTITGL